MCQGLPCGQAPVAQRKSGGLLSRWSGVRIPPGAFSVSEPISAEAPANRPFCGVAHDDRPKTRRDSLGTYGRFLEVPGFLRFRK
jgi:hypothetical protein